MKKVLGLFLGGLLLLAGCYDEGSLNPSPEPELIYGKYTLPTTIDHLKIILVPFS